MSLAIASGCVLGAVLGARHALEPDHLAAVSTLVAERPRPGQAALLGALWGIGHTASLLVIGVVLLLARGQLPASAIAVAEGVVAVMLIVLGARSLRQAWLGGVGREASHFHGDREHRHAGAPRHVHLGERTLALRPLLIGLVHGVAGSGGLTALAMAKMPTTVTALGYIGAFGVGSVIGMAALSGVAGASMGRFARSPRSRTALIAGAGGLSVVVGVVWAVTIAISTVA